MANITSRAKGRVLSAKTATFQDANNQTQTFGRVQLMQTDDNGFFEIMNIKVSRDHFGLLPNVEKMRNTDVQVDLQMRSFDGKNSYYLVELPKAQPKQAA